MSNATDREELEDSLSTLTALNNAVAHELMRAALNGGTHNDTRAGIKAHLQTMLKAVDRIPSRRR